MMIDIGSIARTRAEADAAKAMGDPHRCRGCGRLFDLDAVEVIRHYADCTEFRLPCCGRATDDRPGRWKSGPDYGRIDTRGL